MLYFPWVIILSRKRKFKASIDVSVKGTGTFLAIMVAATALCMLLLSRVAGDFHVPLIYVLAVMLISRLTKGFLYGIVASFISVLCVNFAFTVPYYSFNFTNTGYPFVFVTMLAVSIFTSTMTSQIKLQEKTRAEAEKEITRANLLRAVSHDLRTPLTSIVGATSALLENEDSFSPEDRRQLLTEAKDEAEWLIRMVENLLSVTRVGSKPSIKKESEAVEEIISESLGKAEKRLGGLSVDVSVPDELLLIPVDAMLIEQVILNLLENAVVHAKGATTVRLAVTKEQGSAVFTVKDNGCGIPASELKDIFSGYLNRPVSGAISADQQRNMGIGLSACMAIINAHGGAMTAENGTDGGAVFRFTLPLLAED